MVESANNIDQFDVASKSHLSKLNWLRAAVLGANDGIISVAGILVGVAGATNDLHSILAAGIAGIIAGAISMSAGEYISVSSSRDTEKALLKEEMYELEHNPDRELKELAQIYERKGLSHKTAEIVAKELTANDAMAAHFDAELGIDPNNLTSPWHAALASALAFFCGSIIPFAIIIFPPEHLRVAVTFVSVVIALSITGIVSARIGGAYVGKAVARVVCGGVFAMTATYFIGRIFGMTGI